MMNKFEVNQTVEWTESDEERSVNEGWVISNGPNDSWMEIQKLDEVEEFVSDAAAEDYVRRRAEEGSKFHQRAFLVVALSWQNNSRRY